MEKIYEVKGMTCVICKRNVEKALTNVSGVKSAQVNLLENEVTINFDETSTNEEILAKAVKDNGYELIINKKKKIDNEKVKLILSILLMAILMNISMTSKLIYPQLILATIIIIININFYISGFKSLVKLAPNMDSLVSLSSFISYIYSIYAMIKIINNVESYHLYFETAAMVLVIVSLGKYIEKNTKTKTVKVIRGLATLIPMQANKIIDNQIIVTPINEIKKGDIVRVYPGESIPQDGEIVNGTTSIDESMITGESLPVQKELSSEVIGGTINTTSTIDVKITKVNSTTVLANIINLTKKATMEKLPIERITDKISKYFVFSVIGISLATFVVWILFTNDSELALNFALSVLVISCPCALGLATPAAIAVATGKAADNGLLIKKPEILELVAKTKAIIFDKTGTLTKNKLSIIDEEILDNDFINVLSSIEKTNSHPIGKTILEKYKDGNLTFDESEFIPGKGIIAKKGSDTYYAGGISLIEDIPSKYLDKAKTNNYSIVAIKRNDTLLGIVYLADILRPTSKIAISNLYKRNIKPIMCTGDNQIAATKIANLLNIKDYKAEVKPADKDLLVKKEKENGVVMMVGDGVNDAIALTNADISLTIKQSSDIASASSDVILMKNDLNDIPYLYDLGKKTIKVIKQNLFWALGYNSICIPIAAGVFYIPFGLKLNPMIGSSAMWISSMFVLLNALRINKVKKEEIKLMNKTILIEGMMCERCKKHVEDALRELGLDPVVSLQEKKAMIKDASIDDETLTKAIEDAGYEVKEIINE